MSSFTLVIQNLQVVIQNYDKFLFFSLLSFSDYFYIQYKFACCLNSLRVHTLKVKHPPACFFNFRLSALLILWRVREWARSRSRSGFETKWEKDVKHLNASREKKKSIAKRKKNKFSHSLRVENNERKNFRWTKKIWDWVKDKKRGGSTTYWPAKESVNISISAIACIKMRCNSRH